jgi:hypothetical protein
MGKALDLITSTGKKAKLSEMETSLRSDSVGFEFYLCY